MKKIMLIIVTLNILLMSACAAKVEETEIPLSADGTIDAQIDDIENAEFPFITSEQIGNIVVDYGGVIMQDGELQYLATDVIGLYYAKDWSNKDELTCEDLYYWYVTMAIKEDLPWEEIEEKYKSPFGSGTGWFFPQEYFEETVDKYFGIKADELRKDTTVYNQEYSGYYLNKEIATNEHEIINVEKVEQEYNLCDIHLTIGNDDYKYKVLSVKLHEDGRYTFLGMGTID